MRAKYGLDAPTLIRTFLVTGLVLLGFSVSAFCLAAETSRWLIWLGVILLVPALYALGMFGLMLWGSLVAKVRGREVILDLVPWKGDEIVLDVGCGRGLMLVGAAHRLTTGRAIGVDIWRDQDQSSNTASAALENARSEGVGDRVTVETADMRELPFASRSFDLVVSNWVVHNLDAPADRARALSEMARVVREDGVILLTDIVNRAEYLAEMQRLGLRDVRLIVQSRLKDRILGVVTFGAFQPATIVGRGRQTLETRL